MYCDEKKTLFLHMLKIARMSRPELYASMHLHDGIMDGNLVFPPNIIP
jgi:hypothetical protein